MAISTEDEIDGQFVRVMTAYWRTPHSADADETLTHIIRFVSAFHASRFKPALDWLLENHKRKDWPTVAEIRRAFEETKPKSVHAQILDDETQAAKDWVSSLPQPERMALHWRYGKFFATETDMRQGGSIELHLERYYRPGDPRWMIKAFRERSNENARHF